MKRLTMAVVLSAALISLVGCSAIGATEQSDQLSAVSVPSEAPLETPSPTPTPITHVVQDLSSLSGADAASALASAHITVALKSTNGSPITDTVGWSFQGLDVAVGTTLPDGSIVTLTFAPPPPAPIVAPPAPVADPNGGATARCKDGSLSFAAHHQGACSRHGGVAIFYK
jgi:hypothetical protein